jgi:hypothetical protein
MMQRLPDAPPHLNVLGRTVWYADRLRVAEIPFDPSLPVEELSALYHARYNAEGFPPPAAALSIVHESLADALERESPSMSTTETRLVVEWLQDALDEVPAVPEWLWTGYIARGFTTLLVGLAKTGKTTLMCGLLQAFAEGHALLGQDVAQHSGALLLTEQNAMVFRSTIDNFGFRFDPKSVAVAFLPKQPPSLEWDELIDNAIETCKEHKLDLLVVDTFARWAAFERDNDAPEILRAMRAIDRAKTAGLAVLIVHHSRKAGGEHTEEVSGPVALAGGVDIVLSLRRAGEARVLAADGRSMESPERITFSLAPHEGFTVVDADAGSNGSSSTADVLAALADGPLTYAEIEARTDLAHRTVQYAVGKLCQGGKVHEVASDGLRKRFAIQTQLGLAA